VLPVYLKIIPKMYKNHYNTFHDRLDMVQRISTLKTLTPTDLTNLLVTGSMELENKNGGSSSSSGFSNCY